MEAFDENTQENYAPRAPPACELCGSSCSSSIECWHNLSELTPTHTPQKLEDIPEERDTAEEKKHCELCFLSNLPTDHDESDDEYHDMNLQYVPPYFKGISCNRCGEKDIEFFRDYCYTCRDYNLCCECSEFSEFCGATFISNEGKRHEPNHDIKRIEAPSNTEKMVLKVNFVPKIKPCPRCLQNLCTSTGGSAPCEEKDVEPFYARSAVLHRYASYQR